MAPDPEIIRARNIKANAARLEGLDAEGRRALTAPALAALHQRDLDAVDADARERGVTLDDDEREYQAGIKRRLRMADYQLKAARTRKAKADARRAAERDAELAALATLEADAL